MRSFFGGNDSSGGKSGASRPRQSRHSSGWKALQQHMKEQPSLRVLDLGPTSANNINMITNMGHSIYMADLVEDAGRPEWLVSVEGEDATETRFDADAFIAANLAFPGRTFDVVLLWDTLDYLPEALVGPVVDRLHTVMSKGAQMLGFFHTKPDAEVEGGNDFFRYHLTEGETVEMQKAGGARLVQVYNNRQIEKLLKDFSGYRFFLAKDNLREVIATN